MRHGGRFACLAFNETGETSPCLIYWYAFGKVLTVPKGPPWPETPKPASMPASRTFYQSHIRGLLPKYIKVCPAILYKLLLGYATYRICLVYQENANTDVGKLSSTKPSTWPRNGNTPEEKLVSRRFSFAREPYGSLRRMQASWAPSFIGRGLLPLASPALEGEEDILPLQSEYFTNL